MLCLVFVACDNTVPDSGNRGESGGLTDVERMEALRQSQSSQDQQEGGGTPPLGFHQYGLSELGFRCIPGHAIATPGGSEGWYILPWCTSDVYPESYLHAVSDVYALANAGRRPDLHAIASANAYSSTDLHSLSDLHTSSNTGYWPNIHALSNVYSLAYGNTVADTHTNTSADVYAIPNANT